MINNIERMILVLSSYATDIYCLARMFKKYLPRPGEPEPFQPIESQHKIIYMGALHTKRYIEFIEFIGGTELYSYTSFLLDERNENKNNCIQLKHPVMSPRRLTKKVSKRSLKSPAKKVSSKSIKSTAKKVSGKSVKNPTKKVSKRSVKSPTKKVSKRSVKSPTKKVSTRSGKSVKSPAKKISKRNVKSTAKKVSTRSVKSPAKKVSKRK